MGRLERFLEFTGPIGALTLMACVQALAFVAALAMVAV